MKSKIKLIILLIAKVTFILIASYIILKKVKVDEVISLVSSLNIHYFVLALLASHISLLVSAYRSVKYLGFYGLTIPYKQALLNYYTGMLFNVILPGGVSGDGYRAISLHKRHKFPLKTTARVILYERVNGFYALAVLCFLSFYLTRYTEDLTLLILNTILLFLVTPCYLWGNRTVLRDNNNYAKPLIKYSFIVQLLQVVSFYFLILSVGSTEYTYEFIFLLITASILSILPITIGGIGIRELTMLMGLGYLSLNQNVIDIGVTIGLLNFIIYLLTAIGGIPSFYISFSKRS